MSVKYLATNWTLTSYTKHPGLKDHQWMGGQKDCGTQRRKYTRENHCLLNIKWQNRSWTHSSCDWLQDINNMIAWILKGLTSLHGYLRSYWQIMASGGSVISFGFFIFFRLWPLVGQPQHIPVYGSTLVTQIWLSGLLGGHMKVGDRRRWVLKLGGGGGVNVIKMHCRKFSKN